MPGKQIVRHESGASDIVHIEDRSRCNATQPKNDCKGRRSGRVVLHTDEKQRIARLRAKLEAYVIEARLGVHELDILEETLHIHIAQQEVTYTRRASTKPQPRSGNHPELTLTRSHRIEQIRLDFR